MITETKIIPEWAMKAGLQRCFIYRGRSMVPTFLPGHLLYVRPNVQGIGPGDVIVFESSASNKYIVHRVVSMSSSGFITRGDNNFRFDPHPIKFDKVIGRVEMLGRSDNLKTVKGGVYYLWRARFRWLMIRIMRWMRILFRNPYKVIRKSKIVPWILTKYLGSKIKTIHFKTPRGPLIKTIYKDQTVAQWEPKRNLFFCRKPFDLIIGKPKVEDERDSTINNSNTNTQNRA